MTDDGRPETFVRQGRIGRREPAFFVKLVVVGYVALRHYGNDFAVADCNGAIVERVIVLVWCAYYN